MEWNYVWAAIFVNFLIVYIVPKLVKKPTGVQFLDDTILFLNTQKEFMAASSLVVGVVVYFAHYMVDSPKHSSSSSSGPTSPIPKF